MIKNYLKIAWRNFVKNKGYSAINIIGLATGMAVGMLIGFWIYDEVTLILTTQIIKNLLR